ncbi:MAG: hypothetical protein VKN72_18335 [Nostocales cyanobacterium 94392]|nr:hypothetical protein [Nostocales cyanobacterium 94392]
MRRNEAIPTSSTPTSNSQTVIARNEAIPTSSTPTSNSQTVIAT